MIGYELLFRQLADGAEQRPDGDLMTSTVLFSSMSIGIDRLVGDKLLFCNADEGLLTGLVPLVLPPAKTVIEVLETVAPVDEVINGCRRLVQQGYRLALDDFTWYAGVERFLELASIVKLDIQAVPSADLAGLIKQCREFGVQMLAEKVETSDELDECDALGFDFFQGYLLSRPRLVPGRTLDSTSVMRLRLAAQLLSDDLELEQIESIVRTEPSMTYQLIRLAGEGAMHGLRRPIGSLHEALVLVGSRTMQNWIALLLLVHHGEAVPQDVVTVLSRARMAELLADGAVPGESELAFTAGMLSAFDLLLGVPIEQVLQALPLDTLLRDAAFGETSEVGKLVRDVVDHESGRRQISARSGVSRVDLDDAAMRALAWAVQVSENV